MRTPKKILERRRSVRLPESLAFTIGHEGFEIEARSVNISLHGAMFVLAREIALMTQLQIAMDLPGVGVVKARGVVVRKDKDTQSGQCLVAVFFSDIKPKEQKKLEKFIRERLKR